MSEHHPTHPAAAVLRRRVARRRVLQGLGLGIVTAPLAGLIGACGGGSADDTPTTAAGATGTTPTTATGGTAAGSPAASGSPTAGPSPAQGGTLTVGLQQEPSTLDPHASANALAHRVLVCLYDTLVVQDDDGAVHPALADSWEISSDGTEYTFVIRDGVTFHDGTEFNADAVKFNFDRIVDPATMSTSAVAIIGPYDSTDVVDAQTARVKLKEPFAPFLDSASQQFLGMVSPSAVQEHGQDYNLHPVGTGPFKFVELVPQDHITVERNPDYDWAPAIYAHSGPAYLDRIVFKTILEANTRVSTLKTGETNLIEAVPAQQLPEIESDDSFTIVTRPVPGAPVHAALNVKKPPTDDLAVRQAIIYAVDPNQVVEALFKGTGTPANNVMAPGTLGYDESAAIYSYDPEKAGQILDQAGWTMGSGGIREKDGQRLEVTDAVISGLSDEAVAQLVQGMLLAVGIDLKINAMARAAWYNANNSGENNMTHLFYYSSDPDVLRNLYSSEVIGKPFNWSQYGNPEVDQLLEDGLRTTDPQERAEIYSQAQKLLMEDAVALPLYNQVGLSAMAANVQGYSYDLRAYPRYYDVSIAE